MNGNFELHNRDLSWLSFNYRVLKEADDQSLPLYERIKFLAIYSSNLEEYYKVRVAYYRSLIGVETKSLDYEPQEILNLINTEVIKQRKEFNRIFSHEILPKLKDNNIIFYQNEELNIEQKDFIENYFFQEVLPVIQPALLAEGKVLSFLQDNIVYLAVKIFKRKKKKKKKKYGKAQYAIIKLPLHHIPRFIKLPQNGNMHYIMMLDDIIKQNLDKLFPGFLIDSSYSIKLSRNADLQIEDEFQGNLVFKIKKSLAKRKTGKPARFTYDEMMPKGFLKVLKNVFNLSSEDLMPTGRYSGMSDLFSFPNPFSPSLEHKSLPNLPLPALNEFDSMFDAIKKRDWFLSFPYQTYDYVIRFFTQAAIDPKVKEIKTTQYRVAKNSAIVNALIGAAQNGKDVTVFVEYKARFDEEVNLKFAEKMQNAGIKIIHSIPGIKVHAKVALVLRTSSSDKRITSYAYLSTGNFNEKTAKLYADHGLFTSKPDIIEDLSELFNHLEDQNYRPEFKKILVAQFNMKSRLEDLVLNEIKNAEEGRKAYILLKMNGLEAPHFIKLLYKASLAGVKIDILVRGVCRLVANQEYSKNINLIRIVDKYLEHARIWVFYSNGENLTYFSSADWMKRNLYRRIETGIPVEHPDIKQEIIDILNIQMLDNTKATYIDENMQNVKKDDNEGKIYRAQTDIYEYLKKKHNDNFKPKAYEEEQKTEEK